MTTSLNSLLRHRRSRNKCLAVRCELRWSTSAESTCLHSDLWVNAPTLIPGCRRLKNASRSEESIDVVIQSAGNKYEVYQNELPKTTEFTTSRAEAKCFGRMEFSSNTNHQRCSGNLIKIHSPSLLLMTYSVAHSVSWLFWQIICRRGVSPSVQSFSNSLKVLRNFDDSDDAGDGCCNIKELTMNLDAEMLDAYVKSFLPASLQEESFHRGAQMLRKELYFDMFPR